ncbi:MAG: YigZ family protein [Bacilli bacterium]|nr:YigZ family protein [Bacilli bacterium]MDY6430854.1 YigZ family protein [Bacilli bacterium]
MVIYAYHKEKIEVLSSIFICVGFPLLKEEDFASIYKQIKEEYPKAAHYPYAFIVNNYIKSSDDGEPSNAASKNLVLLLKEKGFNYSGLIIIRYFGGTKLGLPRLRRTFLDVAKLTLDNAPKGEIKKLNYYSLSLSYSEFDYLKRIANKYEVEILNSLFEVDVKVEIKTVLDKQKIIDIFKLSEQNILKSEEKEEVVKL